MISKILSVTLLLLGTIQNVFSQPSMIYNINRHGIREARDTSSREGGAILLNSAYERLYNKGKHLRDMYPSLLSSNYNPSEIRVNSSSWERTITTANGILAGLYLRNDTRSIPVYSTPLDFDYIIFNYDKCPKYDSLWEEFKLTNEWKQRVIKYGNLTSYLNNLIKPKTNITLSNIFSTWDLYWIQNNRPEEGILLPPIDTYTYQLLTEATYWVETMRYSSRISGNYLGSTLLEDIKYRMDRFKNKVSSQRWISTSSHYANILNVLATLGYTGKVSQSIPDYNSVLTFELYNKSGNINFKSGWSVKIRYWDGLPNDNSTSITLGNCLEGQDCEIDYDTFWVNYKTKNLKEWCSDCNSNLFICKVAFPDNIIITKNIYDTINDTDKIQIAILSFVVLLVVIAMYQVFKRRPMIKEEDVSLTQV